jgi:hypothetical protein
MHNHCFFVIDDHRDRFEVAGLKNTRMRRRAGEERLFSSRLPSARSQTAHVNSPATGEQLGGWEYFSDQ